MNCFTNKKIETYCYETVSGWKFAQRKVFRQNVFIQHHNFLEKKVLRKILKHFKRRRILSSIRDSKIQKLRNSSHLGHRFTYTSPSLVPFNTCSDCEAEIELQHLKSQMKQVNVNLVHCRLTQCCPWAKSWNPESSTSATPRSIVTTDWEAYNWPKSTLHDYRYAQYVDSRISK